MGFLNNKKGGEKILSIWWFFVLVIIGVGIVGGILIYTSANIDVREIEANILAKKAMGCVVNQGFLNDDILKDDFDLSKECGLDEEILGRGSMFYVKVSVYDKDEEVIKDVPPEGSSAYEKDCEIAAGVKAEKYPKCVTIKENVLYYDGDEVKVGGIVILAASNQEGKNVVG